MRAPWAAAAGDLRFAWRGIRRNKLLAMVVVGSLGVGIGVNTTVFLWLQAVVLRPLPGVRSPSRFVMVEPRTETGSYPGASWLEFQDLRRMLRTSIDPFAFRMTPLNVGDDPRSERHFGQLVSGNYFSSLGLRAYRGRLIDAADAVRPGGEPVAAISYSFWKNYLGGAQDAVGRVLRVNQQRLTIVGIAPDRFQGTVLGLSFDLWVPATMAPALLSGSNELQDRSLRGYSVMTEMKPGIGLAAANADVAGAMRELGQAFPETNAAVGGEVVPFWRATRGPQRMLAGAVAGLQGVMLLLLAAVCANTACLLLARAAARRREIAVRMTLGAGRWDVVRALGTEELLLAALSTVVGLALAAWATDALRAVPIITAFPIRFQTGLDIVGAVFAGALGTACALAFGLAPALQLASIDPAAALRSSARTASGSGLLRALMAVEVGLATAVLVAAGLFLRSFTETRGLDPGFRREGVLLAAYDFTGRDVDDGQAREFARRLLTRLNTVRGIESAAIASSVPLDIHGLPMRSFTVEGRARSQASPDVALSNTVTPGYFATIGIELTAGPGFADLGDPAAPPQVVVNEEFVRRFIGEGGILGRRIESRGRNYMICGVVRNTIADAFGESFKPIVYFSYRDRPAPRGEIHVRTRPGAEALVAAAVERTVRDIDPALPIYDVRTLGEHIEKNLFLRRVPARMFVVLGPLLLVLASVGIYAAVAYALAQRTGEIALRLAVGATPARLVKEIAGEGFRAVAAGAVAGWVVAVLIDIHLVRAPLFASVFGGVPAIVLLVGAAACWIPAKRASRLDPSSALRQL